MNYPCLLPGADHRFRPIAMPEGYAPRTEGYCREGDLFWDRLLERWRPVTGADSFLGAPAWKAGAVIVRSEVS
jgi:hypothetical protein